MQLEGRGGFTLNLACLSSTVSPSLCFQLSEPLAPPGRDRIWIILATPISPSVGTSMSHDVPVLIPRYSRNEFGQTGWLARQRGSAEERHWKRGPFKFAIPSLGLQKLEMVRTRLNRCRFESIRNSKIVSSSRL
jgi:hypothetical protein